MGIYRPGRPAKYMPATGQGHKPPHLPGIYRIRNHKGEIVYIGETCDLARRIGEHIRSGKISITRRRASTVEFQVASPDSDSYSRRAHERKKIAQHKPVLNKSGGGEGRVAAR